MADQKPPGPMSAEAEQRIARRQAQRSLREAEALRANLQRRKIQARERSTAAHAAVDDPAVDPQNEPSD